MEDGGEWGRGQTREGQLVHGMVADPLKAFFFLLGSFLDGGSLPLLLNCRRLAGRLNGLKGLGRQQSARRLGRASGRVIRTERGHTREKVLAKGSKGVDDGIILLVIVRVFLGSTQITVLGTVENCTSPASTLGSETNNSVVTLERGRFILIHHDIISTATRRREDGRGWGDNGPLHGRGRGHRRSQTLVLRERAVLQHTTGPSVLGRSGFIGSLFRIGGWAVLSIRVMARPLHQNASFSDIDHDVCILNIRRERLSLAQIIFLSLAVDLDSVPTHAHNFNPIPVEGIRRRLVRCLDVNARDHPASSQLVLARHTRSTHEQGISILGQHQGRHGRQGSSFGASREGSTRRGTGSSNARRRRGQDISRRGRDRGRVRDGGFACYTLRRPRERGGRAQGLEGRQQGSRTLYTSYGSQNAPCRRGVHGDRCSFLPHKLLFSDEKQGEPGDSRYRVSNGIEGSRGGIERKRGVEEDQELLPRRDRKSKGGLEGKGEWREKGGGGMHWGGGSCSPFAEMHAYSPRRVR